MDLLAGIDGYVSLSADGSVQAISLQGQAKVTIGHRLDVMFYGSSIHALLQHIYQHLSVYFILGEGLTETMAIGVHFPQSLSVDEVEKVLKEGLQAVQICAETQVWLMEKSQI